MPLETKVRPAVHTSEQIRIDAEGLDYRCGRYDEHGELGAHGDILQMQAQFLAEIAIQLAQLNQHFQTGVPLERIASALERLERRG